MIGFKVRFLLSFFFRKKLPETSDIYSSSTLQKLIFLLIFKILASNSANFIVSNFQTYDYQMLSFNI
ncbi:MAG: hypothetical protein EAZ51_05510 [Sphingobacteriales bacterium]|nr:MAG: hypothetical protein EAZ51_05510 [Sphingobacteriales bacterium]